MVAYYLVNSILSITIAWIIHECHAKGLRDNVPYKDHLGPFRIGAHALFDGCLYIADELMRYHDRNDRVLRYRPCNYKSMRGKKERRGEWVWNMHTGFIQNMQDKDWFLCTETGTKGKGTWPWSAVRDNGLTFMRVLKWDIVYASVDNGRRRNCVWEKPELAVALASDLSTFIPDYSRKPMKGGGGGGGKTQKPLIALNDKLDVVFIGQKVLYDDFYSIARTDGQKALLAAQQRQESELYRCPTPFTTDNVWRIRPGVLTLIKARAAKADVSAAKHIFGLPYYQRYELSEANAHGLKLLQVNGQLPQEAQVCKYIQDRVYGREISIPLVKLKDDRDAYGTFSVYMFKETDSSKVVKGMSTWVDDREDSRSPMM